MISQNLTDAAAPKSRISRDCFVSSGCRSSMSTKPPTCNPQKRSFSRVCEFSRYVGFADLYQSSITLDNPLSEWIDFARIGIRNVWKSSKFGLAFKKRRLTTSVKKCSSHNWFANFSHRKAQRKMQALCTYRLFAVGPAKHANDLKARKPTLITFRRPN